MHVQIGKSGASWVTQALLLVMGSISAAMPVIAAIFGCVVTSFFFAVNGLRKEMMVRDLPSTLGGTAPVRSFVDSLTAYDACKQGCLMWLLDHAAPSSAITCIVAAWL